VSLKGITGDDDDDDDFSYLNILYIRNPSMKTETGISKEDVPT